MTDIKLNETNSGAVSQKPKDTIKKSGSGERGERIPFGQAQQRMSVPPIPGYFLRIVNDEGSEIHNALQSGYEFHEDPTLRFGDGKDPSSDLGTRLSLVVGKDEHGQPIRGYLMKIRNEFREEDIRLADKPLQEMDRAIKSGTLHPGAEPHMMYVPKDGIKINHT